MLADKQLLRQAAVNDVIFLFLFCFFYVFYIFFCVYDAVLTVWFKRNNIQVAFYICEKADSNTLIFSNLREWSTCRFFTSSSIRFLLRTGF